ncbi:MAG TPA: hypothetical protein VLA93_11300 [Pyrinomonadaceae bacterium]|nr:hypothetical protein [Pyrinomonadaceae bacterium]
MQPSASSVVSSTPPFKTKEPETYQAVRSIIFAPANAGQSTESTTTIAREGDKRREEENSRDRTVVYLDVPAGTFMMLPDERIYAEVAGPATSNSTVGEFEEVYVHTAPIQSTYENLGTETVNGTTTTKYKVTVNSASPGNVSESETLIWVDDTLGMPIKSVTRSPSGTRTMELKQITLKVDKTQFDIPRDYQKVEMQVLQQRMR